VRCLVQDLYPDLVARMLITAPLRNHFLAKRRLRTELRRAWSVSRPEHLRAHATTTVVPLGTFDTASKTSSTRGGLAKGPGFQVTYA